MSQLAQGRILVTATWPQNDKVNARSTSTRTHMWLKILLPNDLIFTEFTTWTTFYITMSTSCDGLLESVSPYQGHNEKLSPAD